MRDRFWMQVVSHAAPTKNDDDTPSVPLSAAEMAELRRRRVQAKKVEMAELCEAILENPEAHVRSPNSKSTKVTTHLVSRTNVVLCSSHRKNSCELNKII